MQGPSAQAWNLRRPQRPGFSLGPHKLAFVPGLAKAGSLGFLSACGTRAELAR